MICNVNNGKVLLPHSQCMAAVPMFHCIDIHIVQSLPMVERDIQKVLMPIKGCLLQEVLR